MGKKFLHDLNFDETVELALTLGQKKYRGEQLFNWLSTYTKFENMTNLPKEFILSLQNEFVETPLEIYKKLETETTKKYILKTTDNNLIETVVMTYKHGNTICVSTQIGCPMGCAFCASGKDGLVRNLTNGEILSEVLLVNKDLGGGLKDERKITNVVLMGSGEPLTNYDNTLKFLRQVMDFHGINISPRNISISTCGIPEGIKKLADDDVNVTLSISLHATTDENRKKTMPVAKIHTLDKVFEAVRYYQKKTKRRVCFEYIVSKENTKIEDADRIVKLTQGLMCFVNLIPLNQVEGSTLFPESRKKAYEFAEQLKQRGVEATVRRTMGDEIEGACGQLRRRILSDKGKSK